MNSNEVAADRVPGHSGQAISLEGETDGAAVEPDGDAGSTDSGLASASAPPSTSILGVLFLSSLLYLHSILVEIPALETPKGSFGAVNGVRSACGGTLPNLDSQL